MWFKKRTAIKEEAGVFEFSSKVAPSRLRGQLFDAQIQRRYEVHIDTSVSFMGKRIAHNETKLMWLLDFNIPAPGQVVLMQESKEFIQRDGQISEFAKVMDISNKPATRLHFRRNLFGGLQALLNQAEVQKEWNRIKDDELKAQIWDHPWLTDVINSMDAEYQDFFSSINRNPLFYFFFLPTGNIACPQPKPWFLGQEWQFLSQLFPAQFVTYEPFATAVVEDKSIAISILTRTDTARHQQRFKSLFDTMYAGLTELPFHYAFDAEARYRYTTEALMQQGKVLIREQANDHFYCTVQYTYSLIDE